jgi:hypothetical protein
MNWLIIVGIVVIFIVLVIAGSMLFIVMDLMSYTATGSETLNPAGTSIGSALVVYSPGVTGAAKNAAAILASDLQSKGYTVKLAGIRSGTAANTSGYDVIIVGGPMYWGMVSSSVNAYLNGLNPSKNVELGVFATTGGSQFNDNDIVTFAKQVAAFTYSSTLNKPPVTKTVRIGDAGNNDCSDLVSAVLQ